MYVVLTVPCQVYSEPEWANLHDMTNSIIEISDVGMQLLEWLVTLHLYV